MITLFKVGEVVVAQLVKQWLPASEIRGSNPFIDKFYLNKSLVYTVTKFFYCTFQINILRQIRELKRKLHSNILIYIILNYFK